MKYLDSLDWKEFRQRFPHAAAFLDQRELERELEYLEEVIQSHPNSLSQHGQNRLTELRQWRAARAA